MSEKTCPGVETVEAWDDGDGRIDEITETKHCSGCPDAHGGPRKDMDDLQKRIGAWAAATFPDSTLHAKVAHLRKEVDEVEQSGGAAEEIADCLLILLHVAAAAGVSAYDACEEKFAICRTRKWGAPDADGVIEHIRDADAHGGDRLTAEERIWVMDTKIQLEGGEARDWIPSRKRVAELVAILDRLAPPPGGTHG